MYGGLTSLPTGFRLNDFGSLVRLPYSDLKSDLVDLSATAGNYNDRRQAKQARKSGTIFQIVPPLLPEPFSGLAPRIQ
jgi:hypothetical protein